MTAVELRERLVGSVLVVSVVGDLDSSTAPAVRERLHRLVDLRRRVLVDLSQVSCVSSAGLRVVLLLHRHAKATGTTIALAGVSAPIRAVMASTGFLTFVTVTDTVVDGVRALTPAVVPS